MKKKLLFFIGILLLAIAGWGYYLYNKPRTGVEDKQPDITIAATDLYKQYSTDETTANQKYLNKIISVSGIADEVNKTDSMYTILLKGDADMGGVSCNLFNTKTITITKGKTITIKGKCTGFLMDVALTDCIIEKQ